MMEFLDFADEKWGLRCFPFLFRAYRQELVSTVVLASNVDGVAPISPKDLICNHYFPRVPPRGSRLEGVARHTLEITLVADVEALLFGHLSPERPTSLPRYPPGIERQPGIKTIMMRNLPGSAFAGERLLE